MKQSITLYCKVQDIFVVFYRFLNPNAHEFVLISHQIHELSQMFIHGHIMIYQVTLNLDGEGPCNGIWLHRWVEV